jgi:hypothetical protein
MSPDDKREPNDPDEQESWADLFGSVFESADEVTSRIGPEEIEKRLRRTIRDVTGDAETAPDTTAEPPVAGPQAAAVAERGPATAVSPATEGMAGSTGSTLYLSVGPRSFTVTLDRLVDKSAASLPRRSKWKLAGWFQADRSHRDRQPLANWAGQVRPASFWAGLDSAARQIFGGLAGELRYSPGDTLMREGETADQVMVILDGWTRVSVRDGGGERVVAYRGPGDLLGERAALQVSIRSATVVAVENVLALVMRTQDFAAFISAYPGVLKKIEDLIYKRLTEEPVSTEYGENLEALAAHDRAQHRSADRPGLEPGWTDESRTDESRIGGGTCTVVATDVVGFGGPVRNDEDRSIVRRAMLDMTHSALHGMQGCLFEDRGDGMLIVAPAAVPTQAVVQRLTGALPPALRRHNRVYNVCAQIQMRIAVDRGLVESEGWGMTGRAVSRAVRLLEAPALSQEISSSRANMGVIVSSDVYDTAIRPRSEPISHGGYGQVRIEDDGGAHQAWIQMIDPVPERLVAWA